MARQFHRNTLPALSCHSQRARVRDGYVTIKNCNAQFEVCDMVKHILQRCVGCTDRDGPSENVFRRDLLPGIQSPVSFSIVMS